MRKGATIMAACLFVPLLLEAAVTRTWKGSLEGKKKKKSSSQQYTDPQYSQNKVLFSCPDSHKVCASCSSNKCTAACQGAGAGGGEWVVATVLRAKIDRNFHILPSKTFPRSSKPSVD